MKAVVWQRRPLAVDFERRVRWGGKAQRGHRNWLRLVVGVGRHPFLFVGWWDWLNGDGNNYKPLLRVGRRFGNKRQEADGGT